MPIHVHLNGSTAARAILAAALLLVALLVALACLPGMLLWPVCPDRVNRLLGQLFATFATWTNAILSPGDPAETARPPNDSDAGSAVLTGVSVIHREMGDPGDAEGDSDSPTAVD